MTTLVHPLIASVAAAALDEPAPAPGRTTTAAEQDRMLARLLERDGPAGVFTAGLRLDAEAGEPLVLVLLNSETPQVLVDKIARLNRYLHGNHRHRVVDEGPTHVDLEHVSLSGPPPSPVQSLFVCGLYVRVFEAIGCADVRVVFPTAEGDITVYESGRPRDVPGDHRGPWRISWRVHHPTRVLAGLDPVLLADPPPDLEAASTVAAVERTLRSDPARPWRVADVARALHVSSRSLQRRLRAEQDSFSAVLTRVRVEEAKRLLASTTMSVGDIGFAAGFADTAHLSRTFRATVGRTPTEWRQGAG